MRTRRNTMTETANHVDPPEPKEVEPLDENALNERLNRVYEDATPEDRGEAD
jgi:hypothetical protein